jgi:antirestriction protein ArdC
MQKTNATRVAGFNTWKEMGRRVKKGERGIKILAPMFRNARSEDTEPSLSPATPEKRLSGFRGVTVFDYAQTDGAPMPSYDAAEVQGDVSAYLPRLHDFVTSQGIKLSFEAGMVAEGASSNGAIVLREGMGDAQTFSVLVHETSHELLHWTGKRGADKTSRERETEAEAVAFIVCTALGLETQTSSSDYIQLYKGDASLLLESLGAIQQTANRILRAISEDQDAATEVEQVAA